MGLRSIVALVRTLAAGAFVLLYTLFVGPMFILHAVVTGSADVLFRIGRWGSQIALRIAGLRVRAEGLENLPPGVCLFIANHVSNVDPPIVVGCIPRRVALLAKEEVFRLPLLGYAFRLARFIPINRRDPAAALSRAALARQYLGEGISYLIFAEGTRSRDGRLGEFKRGGFALAIEAGVPIVPVSVIGTRRMLPRGAFLIRSGEARVVFHPPVDPCGFTVKERRALAERVRTAIATALPEDQQPLARP
jgi:1-acyl-sn-glycerol-3-phosphate acyltransferase